VLKITIIKLYETTKLRYRWKAKRQYWVGQEMTIEPYLPNFQHFFNLTGAPICRASDDSVQVSCPKPFLWLGERGGRGGGAIVQRGMATLNLSTHLQVARAVKSPQITHVSSDWQGQLKKGKGKDKEPDVIRLTDTYVHKRRFLEQLIKDHECCKECDRAVEQGITPTIDELRAIMTANNNQKARDRQRRRTGK